MAILAPFGILKTFGNIGGYETSGSDILQETGVAPTVLLAENGDLLRQE